MTGAAVDEPEVVYGGDAEDEADSEYDPLKLVRIHHCGGKGALCNALHGVAGTPLLAWTPTTIQCMSEKHPCCSAVDWALVCKVIGTNCDGCLHCIPPACTNS